MKNIKPLGNRILVKPTVAEEVTTSGIVLPSSSDKEKKAEGQIVALGLGDAVVKSGLKVGDTVVFGKYAGNEVEMEEHGKKVEYRILSVGGDKDEVLAILE
jgi:chaperonin GroES